MSVVQRGVRSRELPPPQLETAWVISLDGLQWDRSEDQPVELIEGFDLV
jgi:hypothetical protein